MGDYEVHPPKFYRPEPSLHRWLQLERESNGTLE
jgi:hypothetical protein